MCLMIMERILSRVSEPDSEDGIGLAKERDAQSRREEEPRFVICIVCTIAVLDGALRVFVPSYLAACIYWPD